MPVMSHLSLSANTPARIRPTRASALRLLLLAGLATAFAASAARCGNLVETASCKNSCEDAERQCLLYGALANQTPSNDAAPGPVLFLNCRSAFYVCSASCDEGATRL
jgi:hypothetical protein